MATANDDRPESLISYIERKIETAIAEGEYPPGSRLSPTAFANKYRVSHIPVREALSSLAARGNIEHRQARGYFTRVLSSEELTDIYHWRTVLETEALKLAVPKITQQDLARMREIVEAAGHKTSGSDRLEYLELNREFHFVAFRRAESPVLLNMLNYLWDISKPYLAAELIESSRSHHDHVRLLELFEAGNLDAVLTAMEEHRVFRIDTVKSWEQRA